MFRKANRVYIKLIVSFIRLNAFGKAKHRDRFCAKSRESGSVRCYRIKFEAIELNLKLLIEFEAAESNAVEFVMAF